jgi:O-antigen ligase
MVMLVFAPLIRGGNRPLAILLLELVSICLLFLVAARPVFLARLTWPNKVLLGSIVLLPLIHLLPMPYDLWSRLSDRELYASVFKVVDDHSPWQGISITPHATEAALLSLLPPIAVFLFALGVRSSDVKRLMGIFFAVVLVQAVLALMQFGAGPDSPLCLGLERGCGDGSGTYENRNHFAGLMEMALPISLALLASTVFGIGHAAPRRHHGRRSGLLRRMRHWFADGLLLNRTMLYSALTFAVILGGVFSRSRTGIGLLILGLILTSIVLIRNFGRGFAKNISGVVVAMALVLASVIGLAPVFERFSVDPMQDERVRIFEASMNGLGAFFPFGSGMGTYPQVMRAFQPDGMGGFVNHAHNDFIEWLFDGGIFAALIFFLFLVVYFARWAKVWTVRNWHAMHMMQVGAGVAIFLIVLHGLTDYNLRIPANMIYAAFLAAVFFHPGEDMEHSHHRRHAERPSKAEPGDTIISKATTHDDGVGHIPEPRYVEPVPVPAPNIWVSSGKRNPFDT